jgi:hypothetical protein
MAFEQGFSLIVLHVDELGDGFDVFGLDDFIG